ncbi:MAG: transketolase [bacterium]
MALIDSKTGNIRKKYTIEELIKIANLMRGYNLIALYSAGSGHAGGTLSMMDIAAALYLDIANHDPLNPDWENRDKIIWSTGHKAPALYISLGMAGFFDINEIIKLRQLGSPFQGHPYCESLKGVEISTGSLGQGLSVGVGMALAAKLDNKNSMIYVLTGDGEHQSGQIWEALMEASHYKLNNLVNILDKNNLQIDGDVAKVMNIDPIKDKYISFGWNVVEINGHNMQEIVQTLKNIKNENEKPTLVIAHTIKGKGISFIENKADWHGKAPKYEEMIKGLEELGIKEELPVEDLLKKAKEYVQIITQKLKSKEPKFSKDYSWQKDGQMKVKMGKTREGFGLTLQEIGDDERIVCVTNDLTESINMDLFFKKNPERQKRIFNMGVAEQSGACVAAGLAKSGKLAIFGTYGVFTSGRSLDQLRISICYSNANVLITGAHSGTSVGADGATHQSTEDLFQICGLPNMNVVVPCDMTETKKATKFLVLELKGPKYIRYGREATPIITNENTPFVFGKANIIRYRKMQDEFINAFETKLSSEYMNENENLTIIACGTEVPEAMKAAYILKEEYGIETRVINMHTLKPLDNDAVIKAAAETSYIITVEDHQAGGLGNRISSVISQSKELYKKNVLLKMLGLNDTFGKSGTANELMQEFELSAEYIAEKAKKLIGSNL